MVFGGLCCDLFPLQNESELFGRTIRVNLAKPMRIKEGSSRPGELVPGKGRTSLWIFGASCISLLALLALEAEPQDAAQILQIPRWEALPDLRSRVALWFGSCALTFFLPSQSGQMTNG